MEKSESYKKGEELMRKMGGDTYIKNRAERARLSPEINELIVGTLYGNVLQRAGLDKRTRSLCLIATAVAMPEIRRNLSLHLRGAIVNGATKEEVLEVILQTAFFTGFPRAVTALEAAVEVFKEPGLLK